MDSEKDPVEKTQEGRMIVLTIPAGTIMYRRAKRSDGTSGTDHNEPARHERRVLALPSYAPGGAKAWSFKWRDAFWYVLAADLS
jgi:hypothetical protein